jgi:hypothetical protein
MLLSDRTAELLGVERSEQVREILLAVEVGEDGNKKKRKPTPTGELVSPGSSCSV